MIESIVDSAGQKSCADNAVPKAERIRNIRYNRKNERKEIRKKEVFTGKEAGQSEKTDIQAAKEPEVSPIMRLIQQQVEKEIKDDALYNQSRIQGTSDPGIPRESPD